MFEHSPGDRSMLNAESLLGSFRHHDLVPWHDRAGYLVDVTMRTRLRRRLRQLRPDYLIYLTPTRDTLCAMWVINQTCPTMALQLDPSGQPLATQIGTTLHAVEIWKTDCVE
ncbi:hypothetical protein P879_05949 [Paragonimus westermani]|uniref:Uncharacterized protein n=1 Tax=Paragonimus westermani TaxID=34504 RepID=A0A8T0DG20_9TREM|nr:hypothetical protein P879_05949 [Paragonimus westermani]